MVHHKSRFARIGPGGQICHRGDFDLNHFLKVLNHTYRVCLIQNQVFLEHVKILP